MTLINLPRLAAKAFEQVDVIVPFFCALTLALTYMHFSLTHTLTLSLSLCLWLSGHTVIHKLCSLLITQGDKSNCSATLNLCGLMLVSGAVLSVLVYACLCVCGLSSPLFSPPLHPDRLHLG